MFICLAEKYQNCSKIIILKIVILKVFFWYFSPKQIKQGFLGKCPLYLWIDTPEAHGRTKLKFHILSGLKSNFACLVFFLVSPFFHAENYTSKSNKPFLFLNITILGWNLAKILKFKSINLGGEWCYYQNIRCRKRSLLTLYAAKNAPETVDLTRTRNIGAQKNSYIH